MDKIRNMWTSLLKSSPPSSSLEMQEKSLVLLNSYRELITDDQQKFFLFTLLPVEIKAKIFEELPMKDVKQSRLVCSDWRKVIDSTNMFSVIIDEQLFDFNNNKFPEWRIVKCFIRRFAIQYNPSINFLKYPDALKKLSLWGVVLPSNFWGILRQAKNLEELDLANRALENDNLLWEVDGKVEKFKFENLRKLNVFYGDHLKMISQNLLGLFEQSMPNLVKFKLDIDDRFRGNASYPFGMMGTELKIAFALAVFIASHQNLKIIQINIAPYIMGVNEQQIQQWVYEMNTTFNLDEKLGRIQLQNFRLNVAPVYMHILGPIVKLQKNLKDIRFQVPHWGTMPLKYSSLENSIQSSIKTLVSINIQWLAGFPTRPVLVMNFRLFGQATNLRRLVMKRWWRGNIDVNGVATIVNFPMLPATIQDLGIEGFLCITDELKELAEATKSLPKLNYVHICHCGTRPGFGIDGEVTQAFCQSESIKHLTIGPLRNRILGTEDEEYRTLRSLYDHDLFRSGQITNFDFDMYRRRRQFHEEFYKPVKRGGGMLSCFS